MSGATTNRPNPIVVLRQQEMDAGAHRLESFVAGVEGHQEYRSSAGGRLDEHVQRRGRSVLDFNLHRVGEAAGRGDSFTLRFVWLDAGVGRVSFPGGGRTLPV